MPQLLYAKQLTQSDAACSKQIKLPKNEARKFAGDLKHRQSITLDVKDMKGRAWMFLCTCYGCQYALSRVGSFAKEYNLKAGDILVFLLNDDNQLVVTVNEHVPSHMSVPVPRAHKAPHRRKAFTTRPPTSRSNPTDTSSFSSAMESDVPIHSCAAPSHSPPGMVSKPRSFDEDYFAHASSPHSLVDRTSFTQMQRPTSPRRHPSDSDSQGPNPVARPTAIKRPADEVDFRSANLMHLIKKVCKDDSLVKQEEATEGSSGPSAISGGTASGASTGMRLVLPTDDEVTAPETTSRCPQQLQQQLGMPNRAHTRQPIQTFAQKPAPSSSRPLFQPPAARVSVLASVSLPAALTKCLTKMDVACAHDQVGIVLPREDVGASGLLLSLDEETAMHFVVEDAMADSGITTMPCSLTLSGNRKFWYLTGLGPFLKRYSAVHGQVLELSRVAGGPLVAFISSHV